MLSNYVFNLSASSLNVKTKQMAKFIDKSQFRLIKINNFFFFQIKTRFTFDLSESFIRIHLKDASISCATLWTQHALAHSPSMCICFFIINMCWDDQNVNHNRQCHHRSLRFSPKPSPTYASDSCSTKCGTDSRSSVARQPVAMQPDPDIVALPYLPFASWDCWWSRRQNSQCSW